MLHPITFLTGLQGERLSREFGFHLFGAIIYTGVKGGERLGRTFGATREFEDVMKDPEGSVVLGQWLNDISAYIRRVVDLAPDPMHTDYSTGWRKCAGPASARRRLQTTVFLRLRRAEDLRPRALHIPPPLLPLAV